MTDSNALHAYYIVLCTIGVWLTAGAPGLGRDNFLLFEIQNDLLNFGIQVEIPNFFSIEIMGNPFNLHNDIVKQKNNFILTLILKTSIY